MNHRIICCYTTYAGQQALLNKPGFNQSVSTSIDRKNHLFVNYVLVLGYITLLFQSAALQIWWSLALINLHASKHIKMYISEEIKVSALQPHHIKDKTSSLLSKHLNKETTTHRNIHSTYDIMSRPNPSYYSIFSSFHNGNEWSKMESVQQESLLCIASHAAATAHQLWR